ncbi:MAG: tandem-95 repeat protein, partial [Deltaproteobacteria bacterium]|nr:tandem-95 repeat protein [Deltaproteobacteria bacterium]
MLEVPAPGVLLNDRGLRLVATQTSNGTHGLVELAGTGSFRYTPDPSFQGGLDSFTYSVDSGRSATTIIIEVVGINDPPVGMGETFESPEDELLTGSVVGNAFDPEGDPFTVELVAPPLCAPHHLGPDGFVPGTFFLSPTGDLGVLCEQDFNGSDSFSYRLTDVHGAQSPTLTAVLSVLPRPDPPIAQPDVAEVQEDDAVLINVLQNDVEVDGEGMSVVLQSPPTTGQAEVLENELLFLPPSNFFGTATLEYVAVDETLLQSLPT